MSGTDNGQLPARFEQLLADWNLDAERSPEWNALASSIEQAAAPVRGPRPPQPGWLFDAPLPPEEGEPTSYADVGKLSPERSGAYRRSIPTPPQPLQLVAPPTLALAGPPGLGEAAPVPSASANVTRSESTKRGSLSPALWLTSLIAAAAVVVLCVGVHKKAAPLAARGLQPEPQKHSLPTASGGAMAPKAEPQLRHESSQNNKEGAPLRIYNPEDLEPAPEPRLTRPTRRLARRRLVPSAKPAPQAIATTADRVELGESRMVPAAARSSYRVRPSIGEAQLAVGARLSSAGRCLPRGQEAVLATVTFESSGRVAGVAVSGASEGAALVRCIRARMSRAQVAPFADASFEITTTVRP